MDERLGQLADAVTAGLRDDPELRLDVRAEVLSHLEETADAQGGAEAAMAAFGAPREVAAALLQANLRRMKLRALARLGVRAVLVPAAVLVTLWLLADMFGWLAPVRPGKLNLSASLAVLPEPTWRASAAERQRLAQLRFLVEGDTRRPTRAMQLRAIWEKYPREKAYYAYYVLALFAQGGIEERMTAEFIRQQPVELTRFTQEIRQGETLDPQNALYNYLLANKLTKIALEEQSHSHRDPATGQDISTTTYTIKNRRLLEQAMAEYLRGTRKPYCRTYQDEMLRQWRALSPPMRYYRDLGLLATPHSVTDLQYERTTRELPRTAAYYAGVLHGESRTREARACLDAWAPFTRQKLDEMLMMMDWMNVVGAVGIMNMQYPPMYAALGAPEAGEALRARTAQLLEAHRADRKKRRAGSVQTAYMERHGGLLTAIALTNFADYVTPEELAPERTTFYLFLNKLAVVVIVLLLLALLLRTFLLSLRWSLGLRQTTVSPLLLLPEARAFARIFFLGIVLPLGLYYLYTQWPLLSGRDLNLQANWPRFAGEILVMLLVLVLLPARLAARAVRRRCKVLGVAVPEVRAERRGKWVAAAGAVGWLLVLVGAFVLWGVGMDKHLLVLQVLGPLVGLLACAAVVAPALRKRGNPHALYYSTVARSLIPIYATAILLIGMAAYPVLSRQETRWVQRDRLIFNTGPGGISAAEARYVRDHREMAVTILKLGGTTAVNGGAQ